MKCENITDQAKIAFVPVKLGPGQETLARADLYNELLLVKDIFL